MRKPVPVDPDLGLLILRLALGSGMVFLGVTKALPWSRTVGFFESVGAPLPAVSATLNMTVEALAGAMLILGVGVEWAALLIVLDQVIVLTPINWGVGYTWWLALTRTAGAALAIMFLGAGKYRLGAWKRKFEGGAGEG